jgi:4-amino-4-deoxy-L-arabinose transferase-like glycosyltransferase
VLLIGSLLMIWHLGSTGLVDETPPLFAASARAMADTGDWLTPRVNGLPRYDKPPLIYWLMGLGYLLPGREGWDPLGTWAARMPSALSVLAVMGMLCATLLRWPQRPLEQQGFSGRSSDVALRDSLLSPAVTAPLAYALSPLVLLWGRLAVSDALFSGLVSISVLLAWRSLVGGGSAVTVWLILGLAVLAKGPVGLVLFVLVISLFAWSQGQFIAYWRQLRLWRGLGLCAAVAVPWYAIELAVEGRPYWDSFFGYHNLQRFTSVVNNHLQPWWFFGPVLVVASLPFTPLLLVGLHRALALRPWREWTRGRLLDPVPLKHSLARLAGCWLLVVLAFFTLAATKLPSYWLPATPAAALLIALSSSPYGKDRARSLALAASAALAALLACVFWVAPLWVPLIQATELPDLAPLLLASPILPRAAIAFTVLALLAAALAWPAGIPWRKALGDGLLLAQLPMVAFVLTALLPGWSLGDRIRGLPVREMALTAREQVRPGESLAMVGILKPSLHFYSQQVVLYEGVEPAGLVNLADRLSRETRRGQEPSPSWRQPTVLVVIDRDTAALPHWQGLQPIPLASAGPYRLWRLDRQRLEQRASALLSDGIDVEWERPRPERY